MRSGRIVPGGVKAEVFESSLDKMRGVVGQQYVLTDPADLLEYSVFTDPTGDVPAAAVVQPGDTEEVRAIVALAGEYNLPLWPTSRGRQHGLGYFTSVDSGNIILDMRRMNRILDVDVRLGYAEIEVGVTFEQLHRYLMDNDIPLWISPTSGPMDGSVIGNALDKGAGYTAFADHFFNLCGMEVVLADGTVLHTGDGAGAKTWHVHRWGCGPILDAIFVQSNFGIITRAGVSLMPRPPAMRSFAVLFPEPDDIGPCFELTRSLKLGGPVPSTVCIGNSLYQFGHVIPDPESFAGGTRPIPEEALRDARQQYGVGWWTLYGAMYGPPPALDLFWKGVQQRVSAYPQAQLLDDDAVRSNPAISYRADLASGIPNEAELELYKLRPNGSVFYFLPALRLVAEDGLAANSIYERILPQYGMDHCGEYLCFPKASRSTFILIYNQADPDERQRAKDCYRALVSEFEAAGFLISRVPTIFQDDVTSRLPQHRAVGRSIKAALDPNGVIAPGRYGLRTS